MAKTVKLLSTKLLLTAVFVLHVCLPTDSRNFKYSDPPHREPNLALQFFVLLSTTQSRF